MLPDAYQYFWRWLKVSAVRLLLPCALFSALFAGNVTAVSLQQLIIGSGIICAALAYIVIRDAYSYWFYLIHALKVTHPVGVSSKELPDWYLSPWLASLLTFAAMAASCLLFDWLFSAWRYPFIYLSGLLLMPLLITLVLAWGVKNYAALIAEKSSITVGGKQKTVTDYLVADLVVSLLINAVVVLPLVEKPTFSLHSGYQPLGFAWAFTLLLTIVLTMMLFFGRVKCGYVMLGERLAGNTAANFSRIPAWLPRHPARYLIYLLLIVGWALFLSYLVAVAAFPVNFIPLYYTGLLPVMMIWWLERYRRITDSYLFASAIHCQLESKRLLLSHYRAITDGRPPTPPSPDPVHAGD
ncbi:hypothetical protein [Winslowiella iniecta]|uniref:Uncharacterized protein n=2 Tax=Winslowiella iniecta TaxID=1560201 RepID=A0A0L7TCC2_9GAMM|nr:hypothetical protein [Winslowiella iniecta]KOC89170.1 hypothetical protein NG42_13770 [Winslowiella iniecta]KOC93013.1 hypothetical protein NG43_12610 [Winslowiella iniecta]